MAPNHDQPGLRLRLAHEARRIAAQHEYLDALEGTTLRALERGDADEMAAAARAFTVSLEAHFSLEEKVQFPAMHGLDASLDPELAALVDDHGRFRERLESLRQLLAGSDAAGRRVEALALFGQISESLRLHEAREEALMARASESA